MICRRNVSPSMRLSMRKNVFQDTRQLWSKSVRPLMRRPIQKNVIQVKIKCFYIIYHQSLSIR